MKIKTLIFSMITLSILVLTGCSINTGEEEDQSLEPPLIPGFIEMNESEYDILSGGYSWEKQQGMSTVAVQTDHAGPIQMAEDFDAITTSPGETIHINIKENPSLEVYVWNEKNETPKEITVSDNQITVPSSKGQYIYEVLATWQNGEIEGWGKGEISYTFVVEVEG